MARTNKYSSINFNDIYHKNLTPTSNASKPTNHQHSSSSFSSYSSISSPNTTNNPNDLNKNHLPASRSHGRMLVLTRPTPKPISTPPPSPLPQPQQPHQIDQISLRPLGRTGTGSSISSPVLSLDKDKEISPVAGSPKLDRFVPPHLRPGFVGREERPGPEVFRAREAGQRHLGNFGSQGRYGEDGRPKSGGYEMRRMGGESDQGMGSRPRSSGSRPSSSG